MMALVAASATFVRKVLILLAVCFPWIALAAPEDYQGLPIREILFDPALQPLPDIELRVMLPFEAGDSLDLDQLRDAIVRLYETGRYQNIAADAELEDGEVILRFLTRSRWFVGRVSVEGSPEPPQAGQLINATRLELGRPFTEDDSDAALDNIEEVLERNGLYEAKVDRFLDYEPAFAQVNLLFTVTPGPRARFGLPVVEGVGEAEAKRVVGSTHWRRFWLLPGWKAVTSRRTQNGMEGIRKYYQKQGRLLSSVALEQMDYDPESERVTPRIRVTPGPRVEVRVTGVDIGNGQLRRLLPIYQEQTVDQDLLLEGARNLTEHFQSDGYFDAAVTFNQSTEGDTQVIEYHVDRGPRYTLVDLVIQGNDYFDEPTIRERLATTPATTIRYRGGRFSQALLDSDIASIQLLYRSNGFRDVEVTSDIDPVSADNPQEVVLTIHIEEGEQWFVTGLSVEGVSAPNAPYVRDLIGSTPGQIFSEANLVVDRDNVLNFYYNNGYPDATVAFSARETETPGRVELDLTVDEGLRQFVRASLIGGLEVTDREMVQSRINLEPGEPLSQIQIVESQRRLYDLGIFARVDTAVQNPDGVEDRKYVLHQFEEARRWSINGGIGAQIARIGGGTTDFDNPGGSTGFSPRLSFGIGRSNMFGVAHTASMQSQVSETRQRVLTNYIAPQFQGAENVSLSFTGLYDFSQDINTFDSTRLEGSVSIRQQLTRANSLQYRFTYRRVKTENLALDPELVPIFARSARVGLIGLGVTRDRRDDPLLTTRGSYNALETEVASKYLGSETDYIRLVGRNSTYHRLGRDIVLARSLTVGWLANTASDNADRPIPLPERFFSGGASSHRGFPDNQAGPRDPTTGFVIGGRAVIMHSTELRFPLIGDNVGGVLFHDAGNVYSEMANFSFRVRQRNKADFDYMVHSVGIGLRYSTPIGPLRFDVAYSPNSPRFFGFQGTREDLIQGGGEPTDQRISRIQFFFSIGQTF